MSTEKKYNMSKISDVLKFHRAERIRKQQLVEEYLALKIDEHLIRNTNKPLNIPDQLILDGELIKSDIILDILSRHRCINIRQENKGIKGVGLTDFILDFNF